MTDVGYIVVGWVVVVGGLGTYALKIVRRGRTLSRELPDEDKPWT